MTADDSSAKTASVSTAEDAGSSADGIFGPSRSPDPTRWPANGSTCSHIISHTAAVPSQSLICVTSSCGDTNSTCGARPLQPSLSLGSGLAAGKSPQEEDTHTPSIDRVDSKPTLKVGAPRDAGPIKQGVRSKTTEQPVQHGGGWWCKMVLFSPQAQAVIARIALEKYGSVDGSTPGQVLRSAANSADV